MQILKNNIKEKIINAGIKLFKEKGFDETSMKDIANKANISTGNIYRYFKNKQQLIDEMLSDTEKEISEFLKNIPEEHSQIKHDELYSLIIYKIIEWCKENKNAMNILLNCKQQDQYKNFRKKVVNMMAEKLLQLANNLKAQNVNNTICMAVANSIFEGIVYIVINDLNDIEKMEKDLVTYINIGFRDLDKNILEGV